jgi:hypothetical protein
MVVLCYHGGVKSPSDLANNPLSITANFAQPSKTPQYISIVLLCVGRTWYLDTSTYPLEDFLRMFQPHKKPWTRILYVLHNPELTNLTAPGSSVEDSTAGFIETMTKFYGKEDWQHVMVFSRNDKVLQLLRTSSLVRHIAHYYDSLKSSSSLLSFSSSSGIKDFMVMDPDNFSKKVLLHCDTPMILYDIDQLSSHAILKNDDLRGQVFMIVTR